jgi:two-component system response regulator (stage 0 sporulation protein F)
MDQLKKILYIDDEPTNLLLFQINFEKRFNVITGLSGFDGLELLNTHQDITVVISDMKMPLMNGIQFIQKARILYPEIVYFILTGFEITIEIEDALKNGIICEYFQKPFKINEIYDTIINKI